MDAVRLLLRAAAVCVALLSLAIGAGGWILTDTARSALPVLSPNTLRTLDDTLALTQETTATVHDAMEDLDVLAQSVADSGDTTAEFIGETAEITTGRVAVSLASIERSMPGLIEAASIIDDTLATLALLGVDYDPDIRFDDALRDIESDLEGLSEDVAAQGATLGSLVPEIERIAATADSLGSHIATTAEQLQEAEVILTGYREVIDVAEPTRVTITPVTLGLVKASSVLFTLVGITLAALLWAIPAHLGKTGIDIGRSG